MMISLIDLTIERRGLFRRWHIFLGGEDITRLVQKLEIDPAREKCPVRLKFVNRITPAQIRSMQNLAQLTSVRVKIGEETL